MLKDGTNGAENSASHSLKFGIRQRPAKAHTVNYGFLNIIRRVTS
jgi:hypothetical protein